MDRWCVSVEDTAVVLVLSQVGFVLEAGEATGAVGRPGVFSAVGDEIGALAKSFATDLTDMGFLSGVYESVFLHIRFLVEPLPTVLAGKRPDVGVYEQMCGEGGGALEHLPTHRAAKRALLHPV